MANNTLGEWSDGDDDWIFEIDESVFLPQNIPTNTLGEWSDGDDDWIFEIDESVFLPQNIPTNTLRERSDGDDDCVYENNSEEDDDLIRSINEDEALNQAGRGQKRKINDQDEEPRQDYYEIPPPYENNSEEDDDLIRSINEDEVLNQVGRGQKRKINDQDEEPRQDYYEIPPPKERKSKKFGMKAMDYTVRFNNDLNDVDLLKSQERIHDIFHHLLEDVTQGMNPTDQVRFILHSDQLQTPVAIPFLPLEKLTTEKVLFHVQKVVQSNEEFRLNDTVTVNIIHVEMPQGSGKRHFKRNIVNIREYLKKKESVVTINNKDDFCLARALAVGIAKIEKDPMYEQIRKSNRPVQRERALDLHQAANVPLRPCGLNEVNLFQQYLTNYQIVVVSGNHNNAIIYPREPPGTDEKPTLALYYHNNHFDTITSLPGFLYRSYFCHKCHMTYSNTADHVCPTMCGSCRRYECFLQGDGIVCNECNRMFKNRSCYDHHKDPINGGGRAACETVRKCEKCGKVMDIR